MEKEMCIRDRGILKHINISSDDMVVFEKVKSDQKLKTDAAVLKYLLNMYMENMDEDIRNQKLVDMFMEAFSKNYYAFFERLRWATRTSEENSIFLLDAVNTILVNDNIKDEMCIRDRYNSIDILYKKIRL